MDRYSRGRYIRVVIADSENNLAAVTVSTCSYRMG